MDSICEGPACTKPVTQPKTGRRRRFCTPACRKAAFTMRHNAIIWEPLTNEDLRGKAVTASASNPDEAVAVAVLEARTLAGTFRNLGRRARPQFAWRCTKTGDAIHVALDDFFKGVDR